jgi:hypothetical protein
MLPIEAKIDRLGMRAEQLRIHLQRLPRSSVEAESTRRAIHSLEYQIKVLRDYLAAFDEVKPRGGEALQ